MKIVFMGTPEFAVPVLEELIDNYDVKAVVTQPDKPKGRGHKLAFSPVKETAVKHNILVYQPVKLRNDSECIENIKEIEPDFIIVVAFGQILTKEVLDIPKYGCINLHASLLPKYRGAAPINYAIINGEERAGISTMFMNEGIDTGDILLQKKFNIDDKMTFGELHDLFMNNGGKLVKDTIEGLVNKSIEPIKQDDSLSTYVSTIDKNTCIIDWNNETKKIYNLIRGLSPYPLAQTKYKDNTMKIVKSEMIMDEGKFQRKNVPGRISDVSKNGIVVETGNGLLNLKVIQFSGKKALDIRDFLNGNTIDEGEILKGE